MTTPPQETEPPLRDLYAERRKHALGIKRGKEGAFSAWQELDQRIKGLEAQIALDSDVESDISEAEKSTRQESNADD
ncbi:MAG: hypothetical protein ABR548_07090 [Actinomycetota bacterium]